MADAPQNKNKPAKKTPPTKGFSAKDGLNPPPKATKGPTSIPGTAHQMRFGLPEHNANEGKENAAREKRGKKDAK